jgi:OmpA-OmpF porin, OOP family
VTFSRRALVSAAILVAATPLISLRAQSTPSRYFLIYFRWNSSVLRPNMQKLVREAAQAAKHYNSTRIEVTGYTDTSMSDAESADISIRMAKAVANELTRHGLEEDRIVIRGLGEKNLSKVTADGVVEPRNRRVEIVIK